MSISSRLSTGLAIVLCLSPGLALAGANPMVLPFSEDFEGASPMSYSGSQGWLSNLPGWSFEASDVAGRLRLNAGPGFAQSGNQAATMDSGTNGTTSENSLILYAALPSYSVVSDGISLSFSFMHHDDEEQDGDRVWVRGSYSDPWVELLNWHDYAGAPGVYTTVDGISLSSALAAAGQDFSWSTAIRFGQEDNFGASTTTSSDGLTIDDVTIDFLPSDDLAATSVALPTDNCGTGATYIEATFKNLGFLDAGGETVSLDVSGSVTASASAVLPTSFPYGAEETVSFGPFDLSAGGIMTLTASTNLLGDSDSSNDSVAVTETLEGEELEVLGAEPGCPGTSASLVVDGAPNTYDFAWRDSPTGPVVATGSSYNTPPLQTTTSFWVERAPLVESLGASSNTIGAGGFVPPTSSGVLLFEAFETVILESVVVYPDDVGEIHLAIGDASNGGDNQYPAVYTVDASEVGLPVTVPIDLVLEAGQWGLLSTEDTEMQLWTNSEGGQFPYVGSLMNLVGAFFAPSTYHPAFYSVTASSYECSDVATEVVVERTVGACETDLKAQLIGPKGATAGEGVDWTVVVTNNGDDTAFNAVVALTKDESIAFVENVGDYTGSFTSASTAIVGDIAPGQSLQFDSMHLIPSGWDVLVPATVELEVSASGAEVDPSDNTAVLNTPVYAVADLGLGFVPSMGAVAGELLSLDLTVTNNGPSDATDVAIGFLSGFDELDFTPVGCLEVPAPGAPCQVGTVPAGTTVTVTLEIQLAADLPSDTTLNLLTDVTASAPDFEGTNNEAELELSVVRNTAIALTASLEPEEVPTSGGTTLLTTRVTNEGPSWGGPVPISLTLPEGVALTSFDGCTDISGEEDGAEFLCEVDVRLAPEEQVASFTLEVASGLSGVLPIVATVQPVFSDSTPTDDSATVELTIGDSASGDDDDDDDDRSGTDLTGCECSQSDASSQSAGLFALLFAIGLVRRRLRR